MTTKAAIAARIEAQFQAGARVRAALSAEPEAVGRRDALRVWQSARLARTHADLLENPRYARTTAFFLSDIYGPKDLSRHEDAVRLFLPFTIKVLPASGLETMADAIELSALSESLDAAMVPVLGGKISELTAEDYAAAYRSVGRRSDRERQIDLIVHLGQSLDQLTRKPLIGTVLKAMRGPAFAAGIWELQDFLERGYYAFREMKGAGEFLRTMSLRERALIEAWLSGKPAPFPT